MLQWYTLNSKKAEASVILWILDFTRRQFNIQSAYIVKCRAVGMRLQLRSIKNKGLVEIHSYARGGVVLRGGGECVSTEKIISLHC